MLSQKFPRICKSRDIPILNNDSSPVNECNDILKYENKPVGGVTITVWMSDSLVLYSTDSSKRLIHSEISLYEWVTESLTHLICSKTWINSVTKHRRVARRQKNSSAVALIETIFIIEIEQKQSILCLKYKSNVILTSCSLNYYCIKPHCDGVETFWSCNVVYLNHILYISCIYFTTAVCIYKFLWIVSVNSVALICLISAWFSLTRAE